MNAKQQAAADLRRMSQMLKGIIAVGDELEALGSIEQAVAEAQSRIIKLQGDEEALRLRLIDADATLQAATMAVESVTRKADEQANNFKLMAVSEAKAIVDEARRQAANIIHNAKESAADLDASYKDKRALLRSLNSDTVQAQSRLDEVNAKLSELRKRL